MMTFSRRRLMTLTLLAVCTAASVASPLQADTAVSASGARNLDLAASEAQPLVDGLAQDLGPLLAAAQYGRAKDDPAAPENSLMSVQRIAEALRAHRGVAYVALAERMGGGDSVQLGALYVLEGAPIGGGATAGPTTSNVPGRAAIELDLTGKSAQPLVASLSTHLGALLPPAGTGKAAKVEDVIAALEGQGQLTFMVLTQRAGMAMVEISRVFVVPDVLRISITDDASPSQEAPEVELVPGDDGGPPMIKFEFDPEKYDVTKKK